MLPAGLVTLFQVNITTRWHQDVKPDNILVASGGRKSDFGCQFKLADLGLCHFLRARSHRKGKQALYPPEDPAHGDAYGTRIYGMSRPRKIFLPSH